MELLITRLGREAFGGIRFVDCSLVRVHRYGANPIGGQA
jgi:hypothetical protein